MTTTFFTGGLVFDGTGTPPMPWTVEVCDDTIARCGPDIIPPPDAVTVDLGGATLLPGVVDAHVHLLVTDCNTWRLLQNPWSMRFYEAVRNAQATLAGGVTTVRDAGGADAGFRQAVTSGLIRGPRTLISITMMSQTGGHGDGMLPCGLSFELFGTYPGLPKGVADGPDGVRALARQLIRAGADQIKIATTGGVLSPSDDPRHSQFREDELAVVLAEAGAVNIPVMAHAQGTPGIIAAVKAGVRSIEHGIYLDNEAIDLMAERGTWLVPTLVAPLEVIRAAERGEVLEPAMVAKAKMVVDIHRESVIKAVAAGLKIAMGTDAAVGPHGHNLDEITELVSCGMSPYAAWRSATSAGAELLRLENQIGRIAPGFQADLVVIDGGGIENTANLPARVRETWQAGQRVHLRDAVL